MHCKEIYATNKIYFKILIISTYYDKKYFINIVTMMIIFIKYLSYKTYNHF